MYLYTNNKICLTISQRKLYCDVGELFTADSVSSRTNEKKLLSIYF